MTGVRGKEEGGEGARYPLGAGARWRVRVRQALHVVVQHGARAVRAVAHGAAQVRAQLARLARLAPRAARRQELAQALHGQHAGDTDRTTLSH